MGEKGKSGNPAHGPNSRFFQANDALVRGKKSKLLERFENLAARAGFSSKMVQGNEAAGHSLDWRRRLV
jgi:hypothetical protein